MKSPRTNTSFFFSAAAVYILFLSLSQSKLDYYIEFLFSYRRYKLCIGRGYYLHFSDGALVFQQRNLKEAVRPRNKIFSGCFGDSECLCSFSRVRTVNHTALRSKTSVTCLEGTWCLNEVKLLSCNAKCYHYCYRPLNTGKKWQQKVVDNLYLKVSIVVEEQVRTNIKGNGNTVLQKTCSNMFIPLTVSYVLNVDCNVL